VADMELAALLAQKQFADLDVEAYRGSAPQARRTAAGRFVRGNIAFQAMARKPGPLLTEEVLEEKRQALRRELAETS